MSGRVGELGEIRDRSREQSLSLVDFSRSEDLERSRKSLLSFFCLFLILFADHY
jgi:hypothetical protein